MGRSSRGMAASGKRHITCASALRIAAVKDVCCRRSERRHDALLRASQLPFLLILLTDHTTVFHYKSSKISVSISNLLHTACVTGIITPNNLRAGIGDRRVRDIFCFQKLQNVLAFKQRHGANCGANCGARGDGSCMRMSRRPNDRAHPRKTPRCDLHFQH